MSNKELWINPPKVFNGNQDNFIPFVQDAQVYLSLNDKAYNTDQKKIIYVLSYMNEGMAKTWKEAFLDGVFSSKNQDYGKFTDFLLNIKGAFSTANSEGEAWAQLWQLKQGKGTANEYISQFQILAGQSRINDDKALVEYFMEGIHTSILSKIFALNKIPTSIQEWYDKAFWFDTQYQRFQEISSQNNGFTPQTRKTNTPWYVHSPHNPNAMDINRLTTEDRELCMKECWCFNCRKIGHNARDCRSKNTEGIQYQGIKKTAATTWAMICNLTKDVNTEERNTIIREAIEEVDF